MYSEAKLAFFIYLWYPKTKVLNTFCACGVKVYAFLNICLPLLYLHLFLFIYHRVTVSGNDVCV